MTFRLFGNVIQTDLERYVRSIRSTITAAVPGVESEMARMYAGIVRGNFGSLGIDRPAPWPMLSQSYAKQVGREYATLYVGGALEAAVKQENNKVSVSDSEVPYATAHQFGTKKMPARPYFPMHEDGTPTRYTLFAINQTAKVAMKKAL